MRAAGRAVAAALETTAGLARPGVLPAELECAAVSALHERNAAPALPDPGGVARALSLSRGEVVCGAAPTGERLGVGELLTVECAGSVHGWCAWSAIGLVVGTGHDSQHRLTGTAVEALRGGIGAMTVGNRLGDVGHAVGLVARGAGCGVPVPCGHGIGRAVREGPVVPGPGRRGTGVSVRSGLVLTVVAGVSGGGDGTRRGEGGAVITEDGAEACVFGHTVAVSRWGPRVLTS